MLKETYLSLLIPTHPHYEYIYSTILPLKEGYRIQAFLYYPYLVQHYRYSCSNNIKTKALGKTWCKNYAST